MRINKIELRNLRNDKHFDFHTKFCDMVTALSGAEALKIATQFDAYSVIFEENSTLLMNNFDNIFTGSIQVIDRRREVIFDGMIDAVRGALHHFCPNVAEAAQRLEVVFDTYEWKPFITRRSPKEQTVMINNLLEELNGSSANDVCAVHINDWVHQLAADNKAFDKWVNNCYDYDEKWQQVDIALRDARLLVDNAYRAIVMRINALVVVEGWDTYGAFIRRVNSLITKYR